jgi:hypothetical protein
MAVQLAIGDLLKQKMMEKAASAAKDMKDAVTGGLEDAFNKIKGLITSTAWPALSVVHGKMVSETTEGRVQLMTALLKLIATESFQRGYLDLLWCLNQLLGLLKKLTLQALVLSYTVEAWGKTL